MAQIFCKNHKCANLFDDSQTSVCPRCGHKNIVTVVAACEMCDVMTHRLTKIDSGHLVCDACLREFVPPDQEPPPAHARRAATPHKIATLRRYGLDVKDLATTFDCWKYEQILLRRRLGMPDDLPYDDLFNRILEYALAHGGKWESYCETYVAGGGYQNSDGTSRLDILRRCRVGEQFKLSREPENANESKHLAVSVLRTTNEQMGYIPSRLLGDEDNWSQYAIAAEMDGGEIFRAVLTTITAKCGREYAEFTLNNGDSIGDIIESCERQRDLRFDIATVTARIEVYKINVPYPKIMLPFAPSVSETKAIQVRINKLRKRGVEVPVGATKFDCWKQEQILLRRELQLPDDASHDDVVKVVHAKRLANGGRWEDVTDEVVYFLGTMADPSINREVVGRCRIGESVYLARDRSNLNDFESLLVHRTDGEQLGIVSSSDRQRRIAKEMDDGTPVEATICDITAETPDNSFNLRYVTIQVRLFVAPGWKAPVSARRKRS